MNAAASAPDDPGRSIYHGAFWLAYLANVLLVCANSLTFRFAEFIAAVGGTEVLSGQIVSTGTCTGLFKAAAKTKIAASYGGKVRVAFDFV